MSTYAYCCGLEWKVRCCWFSPWTETARQREARHLVRDFLSLAEHDPQEAIRDLEERINHYVIRRAGEAERVQMLSQAVLLNRHNNDAESTLLSKLYSRISRDLLSETDRDQTIKSLISETKNTIDNGSPLPLASFVDWYTSCVSKRWEPNYHEVNYALLVILLELRITYPLNQDLNDCYSKLFRLPGGSWSIDTVASTRTLAVELGLELGSELDFFEGESQLLIRWYRQRAPRKGLSIGDLEKIENDHPRTFKACILRFQPTDLRQDTAENYDKILEWEEAYPDLDFSPIWNGVAGRTHFLQQVEERISIDSPLLHKMLAHIRLAPKINRKASIILLRICDRCEQDELASYENDYRSIRSRAVRLYFQERWWRRDLNPEQIFDWLADNPEYDKLVAEHWKVNSFLRHLKKQLPLTRRTPSSSYSSTTEEYSPHVLVRVFHSFTEEERLKMKSSSLRRLLQALDGLGEQDQLNRDHRALRDSLIAEIAERIRSGHDVRSLKAPLVQSFIEDDIVTEITSKGFIELCRFNEPAILEFLEEADCALFNDRRLKDYLDKQRDYSRPHRSFQKKLVTVLLLQLERIEAYSSASSSYSSSEDSLLLKNIAALVRVAANTYKSSRHAKKRSRIFDRIESATPGCFSELLLSLLPLPSRRANGVCIERIRPSDVSLSSFLSFFDTMALQYFPQGSSEVIRRFPNHLNLLLDSARSDQFIQMAKWSEDDFWEEDSASSSSSSSRDKLGALCREAVRANPALLSQAHQHSQWPVVAAYCSILEDAPERSLLTNSKGGLTDGWHGLVLAALRQDQHHLVDQIIAYPNWTTTDIAQLCSSHSAERSNVQLALNRFSEGYPAEVLALQYVHEIDPAHYAIRTKRELDLDSPPNETIDDLVHMAVEFAPEAEQAIKGLLKKVRKKTNNVAIPRDTAEKEEWYRHLEAKLKYLIYYFKNLPEGNESLKRTMLTWLMKSQDACGERWQFEAGHCIDTMRAIHPMPDSDSSGSSEGLDYVLDQLAKALYNLRLEIFFVLIGSNVNVHRYNEYLCALRDFGLHLPVHTDPLDRGRNREQMRGEFTTLYTAEAIHLKGTETFANLLSSDHGNLEAEACFLNHLRSVLEGAQVNAEFSAYVENEIKDRQGTFGTLSHSTKQLIQGLWRRTDCVTSEEVEELLSLTIEMGTEHSFRNLLSRNDLRRYLRKRSKKRQLTIFKKVLPLCVERSDLPSVITRLEKVERLDSLLDEEKWLEFLGDNRASWAEGPLTQPISDALHLDLIRRNRSYLIDKHLEVVFERVKARLFDALAETYMNAWFFDWKSGTKQVTFQGVQWALRQMHALRPKYYSNSSNSSDPSSSASSSTS